MNNEIVRYNLKFIKDCVIELVFEYSDEYSIKNTIEEISKYSMKAYNKFIEIDTEVPIELINNVCWSTNIDNERFINNYLKIYDIQHIKQGILDTCSINNRYNN